MTGDEITDLTATDLADRIACRELSPVDIIDAVALRIESLNSAVNAFAWLDLDLAHDYALNAERNVMDTRLGPLTGIPVTIKDLTATHDSPTQYGSYAYQGNRTQEDAPLVCPA